MIACQCACDLSLEPKHLHAHDQSVTVCASVTASTVHPCLTLFGHSILKFVSLLYALPCSIMLAICLVLVRDRENQVVIGTDSHMNQSVQSVPHFSVGMNPTSCH